MPTDGEVRPVLHALHGRHPGARADPLAAPEGGQGGQRGTWLVRPAKAPRQDLHRANRAGLRLPFAIILARTGYPWLRRPSRISWHVPSGFTSRSQEKVTPPPSLDCTCGVGSGGFRRGCLKVVRHLKNCKFTKLADAVEGTRNIWPAEADEGLVRVVNFRSWLQADIQSPEFKVCLTPSFRHSA